MKKILFVLVLLIGLCGCGKKEKSYNYLDYQKKGFKFLYRDYENESSKIEDAKKTKRGSIMIAIPKKDDKNYFEYAFFYDISKEELEVYHDGKKGGIEYSLKYNFTNKKYECVTPSNGDPRDYMYEDDFLKWAENALKDYDLTYDDFKKIINDYYQNGKFEIN